MRLTPTFLGVLSLFVTARCAPAPDAPAPSREALQSMAPDPFDPSLMREWTDRVTSNDPGIRADAAEELARGAERSLPLLRRLLASRDRNVREAGFEVAHRIGPPAIGLLVETLRDSRVTNRRQAADILIDLAPDTDPVQPALCRALNDDDATTAGDAARALGALGERAAPSVPALIGALGHGDEHVRLYAAEALASVGA